MRTGVANLAIAMSARTGYVDKRSPAEVFAWLRPTDLVWRCWANNCLQGRLAGGYLHQLRSGAGWTSVFILPLIRQPSLIIAGADDPVIPLLNARIVEACCLMRQCMSMTAATSSSSLQLP